LASAARSRRAAIPAWPAALALLIAGLLGGLVGGVAAARASAPPPRLALLQARGRVHGLGAGTSASSAVAGAARELTRATLPALWLSPREIVAPAYGQRVFIASAAALNDLRHANSSSTPASRVVSALIVGAMRGVAGDAISLAAGGDHGLRVARHAMVEGGHAASAGRPEAAVHAYAAAWTAAFRALTRYVASRAVTVPASDVSAAAQTALGSRKIGLAGPRILANGPELRRADKPEVFFVGSEACPFCAVERWGMIVALSQFGSFSDLHLMQSDTLLRPAIRSFTFAGSRYRSRYIAFVPVEAFSNVHKGFGYAPLQRLTGPQQALVRRFDPQTQVPFVDVANRYVNVDSTVQPTLLAKMSWTGVAQSLTRPGSIAAQAVSGEAEVLTAEVCAVTGGRPQSVCSRPIVAQYQAALPLLDGKGGGCATSPPPSAAERRGGQRPQAWPARCIV
jgi:hypothetical protein